MKARWLLTAVLSATAIASEKESDTWTLLLTTPLRGHSVVWGKVAGLYKRLMWPAALIFTHFLAFTLFGVIRWPALFGAVWVIFSFNSLWVATGIFLSLRVRKVTFAVIINLLLAVGIYLVAFFVLMVIGELFIDRELPEFVAWYLPYYYLGEGITTDWSNPAAEHAHPTEAPPPLTLGHMQDVEAMRAAALGLGGSLQNAIVLDEYRVLNSEGLRYDNEFVKHKVLDAIGDLYLLGHPLIGQYTAFKSGHGLNNAVARALLARTDAYELVTFVEPADVPSTFQDWQLSSA